MTSAVPSAPRAADPRDLRPTAPNRTGLDQDGQGRFEDLLSTLERPEDPKPDSPRTDPPARPDRREPVAKRDRPPAEETPTPQDAGQTVPVTVISPAQEAAAALEGPGTVAEDGLMAEGTAPLEGDSPPLAEAEPAAGDAETDADADFAAMKAAAEANTNGKSVAASQMAQMLAAADDAQALTPEETAALDAAVKKAGDQQVRTDDQPPLDTSDAPVADAFAAQMEEIAQAQEARSAAREGRDNPLAASLGSKAAVESGLLAQVYRPAATAPQPFTSERALTALGLTAGGELGALAPVAGGGATLDQGSFGGQQSGAGFGAEMMAAATAGTAADPAATALDGGRFAQMLSGVTGATSRAGGLGPPPMAEQITLQIKAAAADGKDKLRLNLKPAELGGIDIALTVDKDGRVQASILVDRPETLDALRRDAQALERSLQNAGLKADQGSLDFNLRGDGQSGHGQQAQQEEASRASGGLASLGHGQSGTEPITETHPTQSWILTPPPAGGAWARGSVNLTV